MARRTAIGVIFSGGGSIVTFRDSSEQNHHDKDIRCCSRSRCCASLCPRKGATAGGDREQAPSPADPSEPSSSSVFRKPRRARKPNEEPDVAESSNGQGDSRFRRHKPSNSGRKPVNTEKPCSLPESPLIEAANRHCLSFCNVKSSSRASKEVPRQVYCWHKENSGAPGWENGSRKPGGRVTSSARRSAMGYSDSGSRRADISLGKGPPQLQLGSSSSRSTSRIPAPSIKGSSSKSTSGSHRTPRTASDTRMGSLGQLDDPILVSNSVTSGAPHSSAESSSMVHPPPDQPGSSSQVMHPFSSGCQDNDYTKHQQDDIGEGEEDYSDSDSDSDDLSLEDQYRDMRMNIDLMSYEELLDLGERIGTVNTALTEEALVRCLKRSQYKSGSSAASGLATADTKCSICQEEFGTGDDLSELRCQHFYHEKCIQQWLQLKNWCPICRVSLSSL